MSFRSTVALAALALATAAPTIAMARDVDVPTACILSGRQVESVTPYKTGFRVGRVTYKHLAGATANIRAEPGLSAEWLRVDVGQRMQQCGMDPKEVRVEVAPRKAGYAVTFKARHSSSAKSVLEQTRGLEGY
jgi:hypothetical protein